MKSMRSKINLIPMDFSFKLSSPLLDDIERCIRNSDKQLASKINNIVIKNLEIKKENRGTLFHNDFNEKCFYSPLSFVF